MEVFWGWWQLQNAADMHDFMEIGVSTDRFLGTSRNRMSLLWGAKPVDDGLDLAWCESLGSGIIACFPQLVPEHGAGGAVGEEEQGKLFLGVGANDEMFHFGFRFQV